MEMEFFLLHAFLFNDLDCNLVICDFVYRFKDLSEASLSYFLFKLVEVIEVPLSTLFLDTRVPVLTSVQI